MGDACSSGQDCLENLQALGVSASMIGDLNSRMLATHYLTPIDGSMVRK